MTPPRRCYCDADAQRSTLALTHDACSTQYVTSGSRRIDEKSDSIGAYSIGGSRNKCLQSRLEDAYFSTGRHRPLRLCIPQYKDVVEHISQHVFERTGFSQYNLVRVTRSLTARDQSSIDPRLSPAGGVLRRALGDDME